MATPVSFDRLMQRLRAAAEPTRLRILAVCASGELTVGELCAVLGQSQPRVSRHLRLLCDVALLVRFREEHHVYYRVPLRGAGAEAVSELLVSLASPDPIIDRDRQRAAQVRSQRAADAAAQLAGEGEDGFNESDSSLLRATLLQELGSAPIGELLDVATGTGRILRWLAPVATQATGVDLESQALRIARTTVHTAGLSHCVLQRGDMYALPYASASFDTIAMDHVLGDATSPTRALSEAARLLRADGRLIAIEDFDRLEAAAPQNALATVRQWLAQAGIACERLRPLDTGRDHLLLVIGRAVNVLKRDGVGAAA